MTETLKNWVALCVSSQLSAKAAKRETRVFALGTSLSPVDDAINVKCSSDGDMSANEFWSLLDNGYILNQTLEHPEKSCPLPQHDVCSVAVLQGWRAQGVRLESLHTPLAALAGFPVLENKPTFIEVAKNWS